MESRAFRRASAARISAVTKLTYRAELARRDVRGKTSRYYDGGEFSPYNVESLLDLVAGGFGTGTSTTGAQAEARIRARAAAKNLENLSDR